MDNNIYSIDAWTPNTTYFRNKIVSNSNLFYYAVNNYTSDASSITNDINNGNLGGYTFDKGIQKPFFLWKHSFQGQNKNEPRIKQIQFGDGYKQLSSDGISSLLLNYNLVFKNRDIHETTAILHFLATRNGVESFCLVPPAPRGQILRFTCPTWEDTQNFYNNYDISVNFVQAVV